MQRSCHRKRDVKKPSTAGAQRNMVSLLLEESGLADYVKGSVFTLRSHLNILRQGNMGLYFVCIKIFSGCFEENRF